MNRSQLEKLYEVNGLRDYKLKTTDDLLKTHGIDNCSMKSSLSISLMALG